MVLETDTQVVGKNAIARNLMMYSASIYTSSKNVLPQFALSRVEQVEGAVVTQITNYVDPDALLNSVDEKIDNVVMFGQNKVTSLKGRVIDIKTQVDTARTHAIDTVRAVPAALQDQIIEVRGRVNAAQEAVSASVVDTLELARSQATSRAVSGINRVLDFSEAGLDRYLPAPDGEIDEAKANTQETDNLTEEPGVVSFAPVVPRLQLLSKTVSKRVLKRVQDQLQGAPLKLRSNLEDIVHVNLLEYADNFMSDFSSKVNAVYDVANATAVELKSAADRYQENVSEVVSSTVGPALAKAAAPVEQSWSKIRLELVRLQAVARRRQLEGETEETKTDDVKLDEDEGVMDEHEELVLSELASALRSVVLPALVSWTSAQILKSYSIASGVFFTRFATADDEKKPEGEDLVDNECENSTSDKLTAEGDGEM
jgi:hypothetical protein